MVNKVDAMHATEPKEKPKRGVLGRLFRRSPRNHKENNKPDEKRERTPSPNNASEKLEKRDHTPSSKSKSDVSEASAPYDEVPEMHPEVDRPRASVPWKTPPSQLKTPSKPYRNNSSDVPPVVSPSPREAAFSGPPLYRWVDIETSAAVKVQAAYRRYKAMNHLECDGVSTSAIRNRARRREYNRKREQGDFSSLLSFCGADLVLSDFTQTTYEMQKEIDKKAYEEKMKAKLEREEQLRNDFGKIVRKQKQVKVDEAYEVVE